MIIAGDGEYNHPLSNASSPLSVSMIEVQNKIEQYSFISYGNTLAVPPAENFKNAFSFDSSYEQG